MKRSSVTYLITIWITMTALIFAAQGSAEIYQYKGSDGGIRYTDDLSKVPEKQRHDISVIAEEESPVVDELPETRDSEADNRENSDGINSGQKSNDEIPTRQSSEEAEKLSERRAELQQTYEEIQAEKEQLRESAPDESASGEQKREYSQKVDELNKRIEKYQKETKAFEKKVEEFTSDGDR